MKRLTAFAVIFVSGLAICQIIFFLQVYTSNLAFLAELKGIENAGYLAIPAGVARTGLGQAGHAFFGALFFTFTIGAGLVFPAMAAAWIRKNFFPAARFYPMLLFGLWLGCAAGVCKNGINPDAVIAFIAVPPAVYMLSLKILPEARQPGGFMMAAVHLMVIGAVCFLWLPRMDKGVFTDVRDHLLLSNPAGQAINDFYYRYTLYPARVIKPLHQKTIKACHLKTGQPKGLKSIANPLVARDYLPVSKDWPAALEIAEKNNRILFSAKNTLLNEISLKSFRSDPGKILLQISEKSDNYIFFRQYTLAGLILALPLGLYVIAHALGCVFFFFIRSAAIRSAAASVLCLILALSLLFPLNRYDIKLEGSAEIKQALGSENWHLKRNALKALAGSEKDPFRYGLDEALSKSPHVPVRYWMARSLANSDPARAVPILMEMTSDSQPNVACAAWAGLGYAGTGNESALVFALGEIKNIEQWYVQQYVYKTLKHLGWKQKLSHIITADP